MSLRREYEHLTTRTALQEYHTKNTTQGTSNYKYFSCKVSDPHTHKESDTVRANKSNIRLYSYCPAAVQVYCSRKGGCQTCRQKFMMYLCL